MKKDVSFKQSLAGLNKIIKRLQEYNLVLFVVLLAVVYGFILFRIATLTGQQPSPTAVESQVKSANVPKIDQKIVEQLQSLQDNSVSVQGLFEEARSNPFE
jgi:hypothetical protein